MLYFYSYVIVLKISEGFYTIAAVLDIDPGR